MSTNLLQLTSNRNAPTLTRDVVDPSNASKADTGFIDGSIWVNTAASTAFVLQDSTIGTWLLLTTSSGAQSNLSAITDPLVASDSSLGYTPGSLWVNLNTNVGYLNVDATPGAAIWKTITGPKNNFGAITAPLLTSDSSQGYSIGSRWVNTSTGDAYTAVSVAAGAAQWNKDGGAFVSNTFPVNATSGTLYHDTTNDLTYLWDGNSWIDIAAAGSSSSVNNYSATTNPTIADDVNANYSVGSMWINVASRSVYVNVDNTSGAAVWFKVEQAAQWKVISSAYAISASESLFVDTSIIPISVTLPLSPILGDQIKISDSKGTFGTNNLTLVRNGNTIMGSATDMVVSNNYGYFSLTYNGSDWRVTT